MTRPLPPRLPDPRPATRRQAIGLGAGALAAAALGPGTGFAAPAGPSPRPDDLIRKAIPGSGEEIPVIGMGTSQTFMVEETEAELAPLREVLRTFHELGGRVVDSSPMYGNAEKVMVGAGACAPAARAARSHRRTGAVVGDGSGGSPRAGSGGGAAACHRRACA